jgi:hypothetical protein
MALKIEETSKNDGRLLELGNLLYSYFNEDEKRKQNCDV